MEYNAENIAGKRVFVLGAGKSGIAAAELMLKHGAKVFLSDNRVNDATKNECERLKTKGLTYELGVHSKKNIVNQDLLVVSPGVNLENQIVIEAEKKGVPVVGELELASRFCRNRIIAITGTNGKSTVTTMVYEIFKAAARDVVVAGNIGTAFCEVVEDLKDRDTVILEVSSYQLETVSTFRPDIAAILNVTPDHLVRHKTMENYKNCKLRIGFNQTEKDWMILNGNDAILSDEPVPGNAQQWWINSKGAAEKGAGIKEGSIVLFEKEKEQEIMPVADLPVIGAHNIENALAASSAAYLSGISPEHIAQGLRRFKSIAHRLEHAGNIHGVTFINDSKATNISAMIAALNSYDEKVILIAGGEDKESDLSVAGPVLKEKVKLLILLGEAAARMEKAWEEKVPQLLTVRTFRDGVETAFQNSRAGDTVLLSPGCASFDMFESFEERGNVFKEIVRSLIN